MGKRARSKTDKLKGLKIRDTTLGALLTEVMKVQPPKVQPRTPKKRKK